MNGEFDEHAWRVAPAHAESAKWCQGALKIAWRRLLCSDRRLIGAGAWRYQLNLIVCLSPEPNLIFRNRQCSSVDAQSKSTPGTK